MAQQSSLLDEIQVPVQVKKRALRRKRTREAHRVRQDAAAHALERAEYAALNCGGEFDPETLKVSLNGGKKTANAVAVQAAVKAQKLVRRAR